MCAMITNEFYYERLSAIKKILEILQREKHILIVDIMSELGRALK